MPPVPGKRPNILFLMSDQHRYDLAGFAGNALVRTPTLDRLAAGAVVFDNCYTPSPVCVPARQALMAGQFPRTCRCTDFSHDLAPQYMTFARRFSEYAYQTVCCGKLHHTGVDQYQGWRLRIGADNGIDPRHFPGRVAAEFERYQRPSQWWDWNKEIRRAGIGASPHEWHDRLAVRGALDFIGEHFCSPAYDHDRRDVPLLLKLSLRLPHYPYLTDERRFTHYLNRVPVFHRQPRFPHPLIDASDWDRVDDDLSERDARRATAAYYGMVEQADAMFGEVVARLQEVGEDLDDWIIVFTSDHGDMLGEHGLWMKTKYFEASARVPCFIRWPRRFAPRRVAENVNLCDLFATLCDLAGIPAPPGLDSRSLAGLLAGDATGWDNESVSQLGITTMIKRDALKYQHFAGTAPEVLFDLRRDPGETCNRIDVPEYAAAVAAFRARMQTLAG
jgi:choline-sulfatase